MAAAAVMTSKKNIYVQQTDLHLLAATGLGVQCSADIYGNNANRFVYMETVMKMLDMYHNADAVKIPGKGSNVEQQTRSSVAVHCSKARVLTHPRSTHFRT